MTRAESSILSVLGNGPQRVTTLADLEGLAQPTLTKLIPRPGRHSWVSREQPPEDRRVVLVSLTDGGRGALAESRERVKSQLQASLAEPSMSNARHLCALTTRSRC